MNFDEPAARECWALLSDPHIDANRDAISRQKVKPAVNLFRVVREVLAERESLDGVIINGDCAHSEGLAGDYATLAGLLHPLREAGLPVYCILGNHDDRSRFGEVFPAREASPVTGKAVTVVEGAVADWVLLDSLRITNQVEGEFGPDQLEWLQRWLSARPAKPVILAAHHYPEASRDDLFPVDPKVDIAGLIDGGTFLRMVNGFPQAKAFVYGHSHDWRVTPGEREVHRINLPPTSYPFNPARPSGWVRALVDPDGMVLELRSLDPSHPEHGRKTVLKWR